MESSESVPTACCEQCGAEIRPWRADCWLCHAPREPRSAADAADVFLKASHADERHARPTGHLQFGISSLLLIVTLVAILGSIANMAPGLGILLVIVAVPALVRTCIVAYRNLACGENMSAAEKAGVFLLSMVTIAALMLIAGPVAIFVGFMVYCTTANGSANGGILANIAGGIAGLVVALIIWYVWTNLRDG